MPDNPTPAAPHIVVAGDPCFDVVGLPVPPAPAGPGAPSDNWRLTGETRTYFLPGGALLMEELVRAATGRLVKGPRFDWPAALAPGAKPPASLTGAELLPLAPRLTREEIVHSLLSLEVFEEEPKSKKKRIRVQHTHGFSGPRDGDPTLKVLPSDSSKDPVEIVVLDDTGNQFRRTKGQWPAQVERTTAQSWIVHKLHRPLPDASGNPLWNALRKLHADRHVVLVSIDDLRAANAPISRGLSWERTALDLVWQLLNVETFAALRDCPHLIVRLGIDGAVYWTSTGKDGSRTYAAWLVYDPAGIEGAAAESCEGRMVGYGSAFTAGVVKELLAAGATVDALCKGMMAGLVASRRLLALGFGPVDKNENAGAPKYPGAALFEADTEPSAFACQPITIIPSATTPDRGYWRLLDSLFSKQTAHLHRAVALTATGTKAVDPADQEAAALLKQAPIAVFGKALKTHDRREIEAYRALYSLMRDYVQQDHAERPLNVAVFGPPGAGKSFGVKKVAKELESRGGSREIETLTFNLSQYQTGDELAAAFHLVRDSVLRGCIPLVFFDEFDTALNGVPLGWLRYFLSPMQDAEFIDRGAPHPIGQAIFVFAGGTSDNYAEFALPFKMQSVRFKKAKGPDFLSRLRATLDIPGLALNPTFDAYGPVEALPCEAAILLRRANILNHQLGEKAPHLRDAEGGLRVNGPVRRALLHVPQFAHGNRSFEALLDMSHLRDEHAFIPSSLPASGHTDLHANASHLSQLLAITYPFSEADRLAIAKAIHAEYLAERKEKHEFDPTKESHRDWDLLEKKHQVSNLEQADDIPRKLRLMNRWLRKAVSPMGTSLPLTREEVERYAEVEHDRWVASKRHNGFIWGPADNPLLLTHPCLVRWKDRRLTNAEKQKDRDAIEAIPRCLAAAGYEVIDVG